MLITSPFRGVFSFNPHFCENPAFFHKKLIKLDHIRRRSVCRCSGWFEFSTTGQNSSNFDDLMILSQLQSLGSGDLIRRPREVHFGGCINESYAFHCQNGNYFVKINRNFKSEEMFCGEAEALRRIKSTKTLTVPSPLALGDLSQNGSYLILSFLQFRPFGMMQKEAQVALGHSLANLHLSKIDSENSNFGFPYQTKLGIMSLDNEYCYSWNTFFIENRLVNRLKLVYDCLGDDGDEMKNETENIPKIAKKVFESSEIKPSLLHGDLWIGNSGRLQNGEVAIFDPASFFGHSEFDLAFHGWSASKGFPGFSEYFYDSYHEVIPKEDGFEERHNLYQFFHLLNHFLLYGVEYYKHIIEMAKKINRLGV